MKNKRFALVLLGVVGLCVGCGTTSNVSTIPGMDINTSLKRSDYQILGTATGEACAQEDCWLGSCTKKASVAGEELLEGRMQSSSIRNVNTQVMDLGPLAFLFGTGSTGPTGSEIAERIATYKAIESIKNADAIVTPRKTIDVTETSFLGLSRQTKSCVKVTGKAIHIKSDAEL